MTAEKTLICDYSRVLSGGILLLRSFTRTAVFGFPLVSDLSSLRFLAT